MAVVGIPPPRRTASPRLPAAVPLGEVDAGEEAFDEDAVSTLLGGSVTVVDALSTGTCDGFLN